MDGGTLHAGQHLRPGTERGHWRAWACPRPRHTAVAILFLALALVGWWRWRSALADRWWAVTIAGAWLVFRGLHGQPQHPWYWALVWLLLTTPRWPAPPARPSRAVAAVASGVGLVAAGWWTWPRCGTVHENPSPHRGGDAHRRRPGRGAHRSTRTNSPSGAPPHRQAALCLASYDRDAAGRRGMPGPRPAPGRRGGEDLACPFARGRVRAVINPSSAPLRGACLQARLVRNPAPIAREGSARDSKQPPTVPLGEEPRRCSGASVSRNEAILP